MLIHLRLLIHFFFTPDEAYTLKQILVGLIDAEKTMIQLALFRLTDHDIAQALIDAHKRGVAIELIIDAGGVDLGHYSKVSALESHGITILVYQPVALFSSKQVKKKNRAKETTYQSIMHHKTFIFYNTIGGEVAVCGSLNPTYAAFHGNEEMVIIRNNLLLVERWKKHFEKLKKRCQQRSLKEIQRKKTVQNRKKPRK